MRKAKRYSKGTRSKSQRTPSSSGTSSQKPAAEKSILPSPLPEIIQTIHQNIPHGRTPQKEPYSINRSIDKNKIKSQDDFYIPRRIGEGEKPIFPRKEFFIKPPSSLETSARSPNVEVQNLPTNEELTVWTSKRNTPENSSSVLEAKCESDSFEEPAELGRSRSRHRIESRKTTRNRRRMITPPSESYRRRHRGSYHDRSASSRESVHHREHYRSRHRDSRHSRSRSRSRQRKSYSSESIEFPSTSTTPHILPVPYIPNMWEFPMMPPQPAYPYMMRPLMPPPQSTRNYVPRNFRSPRGRNYRPRY